MRMRAAFIALLLAAAPAMAQQVYSWTDANGVEHFTDDASSIPKGARVNRVSAAEASPKVVPKREERAASQAPATTVVEAAKPAEEIQQEIPEGLLKLWRLAVAELREPASGPAFLELAETTTEPKVLAIALHAVGQLYTSRTSVSTYSFEGKSYPSLPANDRVFRVGLQYLDHPDKFVRGGAARLVGLGIARVPPNEQLITAVGERFSSEPDIGLREQLLDVLWSCHCGARAMAEAAIWFAEQKEPQSRIRGLKVMLKVGKKGRNFDAEARAQMRRAAETLLSHPSADVRTAAEAAAKACASGS